MKSRLFSMKPLGLVALLLPSLLVADKGNTSKEDLSASQKGLTPGYNSSWRIAVDRSYDIFLDASFIFWQPLQENMQLGVVSEYSGALDLVNGHEVNLGASYRPGFQVGLGMNFDYDQWDTYLEYTWYYAKETTHASVDPSTHSLFPAWQISDFLNPQYRSGSEDWKLHMNLLDWDLARGYHVGTKLCFRPFMGMRAAWISQTVQVDYQLLGAAYALTWPSTHIHHSSDSWGIGPRLGVGLNWELGAGLRLVGGGEWDILYTRYDLKSSQISDIGTTNRYIVKTNNLNSVRNHVNLDLGLGWGSYFLKSKYHIDLLADYCFQTFFGQNMFRNTSSTQSVGSSIQPNGNLYLQGLTFKVRLDF